MMIKQLQRAGDTANGGADVIPGLVEESSVAAECRPLHRRFARLFKRDGSATKAVKMADTFCAKLGKLGKTLSPILAVMRGTLSSGTGP